MDNFLVTFCNADTQITGTNALYIDVANKRHYWILTGIQSGFTGAAYTDSHLFFLHQGEEPGILVVDASTFEVVLQTALPDVIDPHSMQVVGNSIYLVSTGTDSVLEYTFDASAPSITLVGTVWKPDGSDGTSDTHHVNSLFLYKDELYVSAFGQKTGKTWKTATEGYIMNISTGEKVDSIGAINHPHSLMIDNDDYYYCESTTRKIQKNNDNLLTLDAGYIRGLAATEKHIAVGASRGRKVSKSTGMTLNATEAGELEEICRVTIFDKSRADELFHFDYFPGHQEIYEIIPVPALDISADCFVGMQNIVEPVKHLSDVAEQKEQYIGELREKKMREEDTLRRKIADIEKTLAQKDQEKEAAVEKERAHTRKANAVIHAKDRELLLMQNSKFWKMRNRYVRLKSTVFFWKR